MVKPDVVTRKIATARGHLAEAQKIFERTQAEFLADKHRRDLAAFYLFLAIQDSIDLAAHWVADEDVAGQGLRGLVELRPASRVTPRRSRSGSGAATPRSVLTHQPAVPRSGV